MCSSAQSDTGKVRAWNKVTPEKESGRCMLWIILSLWKFLVEIWKATEGSGISMFPGNWDQSRHQYGKLSCSSSQFCPGNTCICFSLVRPRSEEAVRDIFFPYRSFRSTIESPAPKHSLWKQNSYSVKKKNEFQASVLHHLAALIHKSPQCCLQYDSGFGFWFGLVLFFTALKQQ